MGINTNFPLKLQDASNCFLIERWLALTLNLNTMKNDQNEIQSFLKNLPDTFEMMDEPISLEVQKEYIEYSHSFGYGEISEEETTRLCNFLTTDSPAVAKKKALGLLAHLGTIPAFRGIEEYYKRADNQELKQWAVLALQECRMFLESSLTDESVGFISSPMGGQDNKMKCFFMVFPVKETFTEIQQKVIKNEFPMTFRNLNAELQTINFTDRYAEIIALIPFDVAIDTIMQTGIKKCNELGEFVFENYFATNVEVPNEKEVDEIIKKVKG